MFYAHLCIIDDGYGNTYYQMKKNVGLHKRIEIKRKNYNLSVLLIYRNDISKLLFWFLSSILFNIFLWNYIAKILHIIIFLNIFCKHSNIMLAINLSDSNHKQ